MLKQASDASTKTDKASCREALERAVSSAQAQFTGDYTTTQTSFSGWLNNKIGIISSAKSVDVLNDGGYTIQIESNTLETTKVTITVKIWKGTEDASVSKYAFTLTGDTGDYLTVGISGAVTE